MIPVYVDLTSSDSERTRREKLSIYKYRNVGKRYFGALIIEFSKRLKSKEKVIRQRISQEMRSIVKNCFKVEA